MELLPFAFSYVGWHYDEALSDLRRIAGNLLWFEWHFFSVGILSRTLFLPWKRLQETREREFSFANFFSTLVVNLVMRVVGIIIRLIFILIGLAVLIVSLFLAIAAFFAWIFLPLIIVGAFVVGILLIVKSV